MLNIVPGLIYGALKPKKKYWGTLMARAVCISLVILTASLSATRTLASGDAATFAEIMRRAHGYVTQYEDHELSTVIARERYHQQWLDVDAKIKGERTLLSDYLLLQLPNEDWVAVRDVYEVDGTAVTDRAARLKALFAGPRQELSERVMRMAEESARYNLGDSLLPYGEPADVRASHAAASEPETNRVQQGRRGAG